MNALLTYRPPEEGVTLRFRASNSFKERLDDCVRLWKLHAQAREENVDGVDMSHFIRSTLEAAMDAEFAAYGGRPKTKEAWDKVEAAIRSAVKNLKK